MSLRSTLGLLGGLLCWTAGCDRATVAAPPAPEPVLRYPAILVWTGVFARTESATEGFKTMNVNTVLSHREQPVVIDSDLKIYDMADLKTTANGFKIMLNPNSHVPITFKLKPRQSQGLEAARKLLLDCQWIGKDAGNVDETKLAIQKATTAAEIIAILEKEAPRPEPEPEEEEEEEENSPAE